jgi:NADH-quinone oxidoreductase subunit E
MGLDDISIHEYNPEDKRYLAVMEEIATTEEEKEALKEVFSSFPHERRFLIRILQAVQQKLGYLPETAMEEAARHLDLSPAEVFGVASFYNQFRFVPLGKYHVVVCMGTACHTLGGQLVLDGFEREFDIKVGDITPDHEYSLDRVGCIGCCTKAPVVVINDRIYAKMSAYKVTEVLASVRDAAAVREKEHEA